MFYFSDRNTALSARTVRSPSRAPVQRQEMAVPSIVHNVLRRPGQPLSAGTRAAMEPRFGHDFSGVRVHTDAPAAASARAVNAMAYTVGRHVIFDEGQYQPQNREGRKLLGHELAHTIQQQQDVSHPASFGNESGSREREAVQAGSAVLGQGPVSVRSRTGPALQRQRNPAHSEPHLDLADTASPFLAAAAGSVLIDRFETGKADISAANMAQLTATARQIQSLLVRYPGSTIHITGHTNAVGQENDNQTLGQARADAVQAALIRMGIPLETIKTESRGQTQLLVKTQKAEAQNRRVQVTFEPLTNRFSHFIPDTSLSLPGKADAQKSPPPGLPAPFSWHPTDIPSNGTQQPKDQWPSWMWKTLPPARTPKGASLEGAIDSLANKITSFLPRSIQPTAQELVKDAIEKGITSSLDAGLQAAGVDQNARQAIGKAVEGVIKQKTGGSPK